MNRCRAMKNNKLVWFNSCGKDDNGKAIKYSSTGTSFAKDKEAVATSLTQRLSALQNELWYDVEHGLPLLNKVKAKVEIDIAIATIVENHPDVVNIESFTSSVENKQYYCDLVINTEIGQLNLQI